MKEDLEICLSDVVLFVFLHCHCFAGGGGPSRRVMGLAVFLVKL